jgi:hypothetical protein
MTPESGSTWLGRAVVQHLLHCYLFTECHDCGRQTKQHKRARVPDSSMDSVLQLSPMRRGLTILVLAKLIAPRRCEGLTATRHSALDVCPLPRRRIEAEALEIIN